MRNAMTNLGMVAIVLGIVAACNDSDPALEGEVWPKTGYLFTTDSNLDTVYVETSGHAVTSPYMRKYPIDDPKKKWTISRPSSGEGVLVHNDQNQYWSIDSAFHPGLMREQYFISIVTAGNTANLGKASRFRYHKSGVANKFYIESVKFPDYYVAALGHAESGRGLLLRNQDQGDWEFWVDNE